MEALVRWQHPERGLLPPSEFITLAEETGLIDKLGEWVMREACSQVTRWRRQGFDVIRVAVNLSSRQLGQDNLPEIVAGVLGETGVPPQCLELEITESSIMNRADGAVTVLRGLRDLGVTLAIDDDTIVKFSSERVVVRRLNEAIRIWLKVRKMQIF